MYKVLKLVTVFVVTIGLLGGQGLIGNAQNFITESILEVVETTRTARSFLSTPAPTGIITPSGITSGTFWATDYVNVNMTITGSASGDVRLQRWNGSSWVNVGQSEIFTNQAGLGPRTINFTRGTVAANHRVILRSASGVNTGATSRGTITFR